MSIGPSRLADSDVSWTKAWGRGIPDLEETIAAFRRWLQEIGRDADDWSDEQICAMCIKQAMVSDPRIKITYRCQIEGAHSNLDGTLVAPGGFDVECYRSTVVDLVGFNSNREYLLPGNTLQMTCWLQIPPSLLNAGGGHGQGPDRSDGQPGPL